MIIAHNIANQVKNIPKFIGPNIICWLPIEVLIKRAIKKTLLLIARIFNSFSSLIRLVIDHIFLNHFLNK